MNDDDPIHAMRGRLDARRRGRLPSWGFSRGPLLALQHAQQGEPTPADDTNPLAITHVDGDVQKSINWTRD
jgi:hypothetical protein